MIQLFIDGQPAQVQPGDMLIYNTTSRSFSFKRRRGQEGLGISWHTLQLENGRDDIAMRLAPIHVDDFAHGIAQIAGLSVKSIHGTEDNMRYEFTQLRA